MKSNFLVYWKDMMKDSDEPLPMRPFTSRAEAECYVLGCSNVLTVMSDKHTVPNDIRKNFIITTDRD